MNDDETSRFFDKLHTATESIGADGADFFRDQNDKVIERPTTEAMAIAIVRSGHSIQSTPQTIEEVRRILLRTSGNPLILPSPEYLHLGKDAEKGEQAKKHE